MQPGHLHTTGPTECLSARIIPRRYREWLDSIGGDELGENGGVLRTRHLGLFWTSPGHALRAPPSCCAYGWPGDGSAISARSRGARFTSDAGEIAPRLQTCTHATQGRFKLTEVAKHSTEISRTPGIAGWRRSQREWQHLLHGVLGSTRLELGDPRANEPQNGLGIPVC